MSEMTTTEWGHEYRRGAVRLLRELMQRRTVPGNFSLAEALETVISTARQYEAARVLLENQADQSEHLDVFLARAGQLTARR